MRFIAKRLHCMYGTVQYMVLSDRPSSLQVGSCELLSINAFSLCCLASCLALRCPNLDVLGYLNAHVTAVAIARFYCVCGFPCILRELLGCSASGYQSVVGQILEADV